MKILAPKNENEDIVDKQYVDTGLSGKQATLVSGTNIKTINNQSILGSGNISISGGGGGDVSVKHIDTTDSSQWDSQENEPTQATLQDIGTHTYQMIILENQDMGGGATLDRSYYLLLKIDADDIHLRQYTSFDDGDEEEDEPTAIETWTVGNIDEEDPTTYLLFKTTHRIVKDVTINGGSITQNNTANIVTNTAYNATSNKIATMSDIPSVSDRLKIYARSGYNLNTCYDAGVYLVAQGTNIPSGSNYGSLLVMPYRKADGNTTPDFGTQIFMPNGDDNTHPNSFYYRTSLSNTWNSWQELETTTNKVTSISSSSTDAQYPSAKCVYDLIGDIETLLGGI